MSNKLNYLLVNSTIQKKIHVNTFDSEDDEDTKKH